MTRYKLLTEEEVSEWISIPVATLKTHRKPDRRPQNPVPFVKLANGKIRYREDQVQEWIEQNSHTETTRRTPVKRTG